MPNAFEAGTRKAIPAVLVYARHGDEVLMVHRNAPDRPGDYHAGKWNGLGGKLELDESPLEAARRELREESGLDVSESAFRSLGVLTFPNFKAHKSEDWICFVYECRVSDFQRSQPVSGPEGELHWVRASELGGLNLWAGDRQFIGHVAAGRPFVGTIWYQGESVLRADVRPIV